MEARPEEGWIGIVRGDGEAAYWRTARLWELASALPVVCTPLVQLISVMGLEETTAMTNRELAAKARRIMEADLGRPILISSEGWLWDGWHRLMKAYALGLESVDSVRFADDPEPDRREPPEP